MEANRTTVAPTKPWSWVPTLYFAQGIPYVMVMTVSVILYKRLGISNADIALYTSWLYLPWVIKPLWSPVVELLKRKRWWIVTTELIVGSALAAVAFAIPLPNFFQWTLAFFWLLAFTSATHDVAADGFYLLGLSEKEQAFYVGVRSTFYRLAMIAGQGFLIMLAGFLEKKAGPEKLALAWQYTFLVVAVFFLCICFYHYLFLPKPAADVARGASNSNGLLVEFATTFVAFFRKEGVSRILGFILFYRFAEAQLLKIASLFLLDERAQGGLGLSTKEVGIVYGTVGVICLTLGGLLGGFVVAKYGLKKWLWPMALAINVPNLVYVYMAFAQPQNFLVINLCVAFEQFGYGLGFTAFMIYLIQSAAGKYPTAHYAICTGFMALGMMVPGMWSGKLQQYLGYQNFFVWVMIATIPSFLVTALIEVKSHGNHAVAEK